MPSVYEPGLIACICAVKGGTYYPITVKVISCRIQHATTAICAEYASHLANVLLSCAQPHQNNKCASDTIPYGAFRNIYGFKRLHINASCRASTLWTLEEPTCPSRLMSSQTETTLGGSSTIKHACQRQAFLKSLLSWGPARQAGLMSRPWLMKASLSEATGPSFLGVLH